MQRSSMHQRALIFILSTILTSNLSNGKSCLGTNAGFAMSGDPIHRYQRLERRYRNCTKIEGNLEITYIDEPNLDFSFLHTVEEITGYLFVYSNLLEVLPLPNLRLIHGDSVLEKEEMVGKKYSLLIANNYIEGKDNLKTLGLNSLVEIRHGDISIIGNKELCNAGDVLWEDIVDGLTVEVKGNKAVELCDTCSSSCTALNGVRNCWGANVTDCQIYTRVSCKEQCEDRCYGTDWNQCCQPTCAGGCHGTSKKDCFACRNFLDGDECVASCPPLEIYNSITFNYEPNPNAKFSYGHNCVKECPDHMYKYKAACVKKCPSGFHSETTTCEPCEGNCPKICVVSEYLNEKNIGELENCTIIEGSIEIVDGSFSSEFDRKPITRAQLQKLESITLIEGHLEVSAEDDSLTDLSFLKNLKTIHAKTQSSNCGILIHKSSLVSISLESFETLTNHRICIIENSELCYGNNASSFNYEKYLKIKDTTKIIVETNKNSTVCEEEGKVCSAECSAAGCWGPLDSDCESCKAFKEGKRCVEKCGDGYFVVEGSTMCQACHPQCLTSCNGTGEDQCQKCKNFQDGPFCVEKCPVSKYPTPTNECHDCHSVCENGCYGNTDQLGAPNGCTSCSLVQMDPSNTQVIRCLHAEQGCPNGHYMHRNKECRKCHSECTECMGSGASNCDLQTCKNVIHNDMCFSSCFSEFYPFKSPSMPVPICKLCDRECQKCTGASTLDCVSCRGLKVYLNYEKRKEDGRFNCTSSCPTAFPNKIQEMVKKERSTLCVADAYAQNSTGSKKSSLGLVLGLIFGFLLLLGLIVLLIFYFRRQAAKKDFEVKKLEAKMGGFEDTEPLMPTNATPDMSSLRVVEEEELRKEGVIGAGAFGTVYKGVYVPRGENVKIPVAVKVLNEGSSSSQNAELLDEARIMASVNHPYCVRLTAICMTNPVQLITPLMPFGSLLDYLRKHKANVGSKNLLNWATQIAKGMEYLERRGIVHRDLAARNVLVKNANVVKITDFGLSKLLEVDQSQVETQDGKLPIKWMAVESIRHKIFTHKSDVWGYGVTIWELFTYGNRPYDLLPAADVLLLLEKGQRLSQPEICTIDIYMLMIKCWLMDSESRPTFKNLAQDFSRMSRDPGRFLVINGDEFMKLPTDQLEPEDLLNDMGPEKVVSMDDYYLQPSEDSKGDNQGGAYLDPTVDCDGENVKFSKGTKDEVKKPFPSNRYTTDPTHKSKQGLNRNADLDMPIDSAYESSNAHPASLQDAVKGSLSSLTDHLKTFSKGNKYSNLINRDSIEQNGHPSQSNYLKMDGKKIRLAEFEDDSIGDDDDYLTEVKISNKNDYYNTKKS